MKYLCCENQLYLFVFPNDKTFPMKGLLLNKRFFHLKATPIKKEGKTNKKYAEGGDLSVSAIAKQLSQSSTKFMGLSLITILLTQE